MTNEPPSNSDDLSRRMGGQRHGEQTILGEYMSTANEPPIDCHGRCVRHGRLDCPLCEAAERGMEPQNESCPATRDARGIAPIPCALPLGHAGEHRSKGGTTWAEIVPQNREDE